MIINHSGGGAPLNFKVLGGTTQPAAPAENTIWVNTSAEITSWAFSNTQPSNPVEGMVWFRTDSSAAAAFNALKKNQLTVYPRACEQYVSGAWVRRFAKTYQNGAWVDWDFFLYNESVKNPLVTGFSVNQLCTFTENKDHLLTVSSDTDSHAVNIEPKINVTDFDFLGAEYFLASADADSLFGLSTIISTSKRTIDVASIQFTTVGNRDIVLLPISSISGSYWVKWSTDNSLKIFRIWLE